MTARLRIVTQTDNIEPGGVMDDCAWATFAAAANHLTGTSYTSTDGIAFGTKVGRIDHIGQPDPSNLSQLAKAAPLAGMKARWPKSWDEVTAALNAGAVVGINVQQPLGYPAEIKMSVWHAKWARYWHKKDPSHVRAGYGHMTCAILGEWADPTMSGKGDEQWAVPATLEQLKAIASSKGEAPHKRCIIWTAAKVAPAPVPAPVTPAPVAPQAPTVPAAPARPVTVAAAPAARTVDPALAAQLDALGRADWGKISAQALHVAEDAAAAAKGERTVLGKISAAARYVAANTQLDEVILDALRTFLTVSISVALGLGIPLLDISGGDFRSVLSAGLASALGVVVKFLDPNNSSYGIKR